MDQSATGSATPTLEEYLLEAASRPLADRPALVVQGGGLRAIYSVGVLAAFEERGLRDSFSMVVGSSAGVINGAYFLANQARYGIDVYAHELSNRKFVNPWRVRKIVDIDFLVDTALKQLLPLDFRGLQSAQAPLYAVMTDAETGGPEVLSSRDTSEDQLYEVFRATSALPGLYNRRVPVGSRRYVDGGLASQVPVVQARALGAKEEVVVMTRCVGHRRLDVHPALRILLRALARGQSPAILAKIGVADVAYNDLMDELDAALPDAPPRTWTVRPSDGDRLVERTTSDETRLRDTAALAREDALARLAAPVTRV